jgi:putative flavoprotein involved in K+ transport
MPRDSVVARVRRYAEVISAPVELGAGVSRLSAREGSSGRFRVETSRGRFDADSVVVATGGFPSPRIPAVAADLPARIVKVHSHEYRNEAALPPGAVLVVGTGQSGVQLAEELHGAGRRVILSVGHCGRVPRHYRGRDIFAWMVELVKHGKLPSVDKLPIPDCGSPATPISPGTMAATTRI